MSGPFADRSEVERLGALLAAAAATEIMPRFGRLRRTQVRNKSSAFDIVTEADEAAEAAITADLQAWMPQATVVGEEATHRDPDLIDAIGGAELAFVVDPLDGTKNFASGLPLFGVMAAVTVRGEVIAGAIHDPVARDTALALRGGGAWLLREDGERVEMKVAEPVEVAQMEGFIGTNFLPKPLRDTVNGHLSRLSTSTWLRCAAHEYRQAAAGHCHVLFYNRLMPWDHAAGWLLHREAGGVSGHFDGSAYLPAHRTGGLICAPDQTSWRAVRAALLGEEAR